MPEDRTQPASKRRRQLAREQGQVVHSPELTAAAGWLAALVVLGLSGGNLTGRLAALVNASLRETLIHRGDAAHLVELMRGRVVDLLTPWLALLAAFAAGALAAHQLQVRGLWATNLIAPDPSRLWTPGRGGGMAAGLERIVWAIVKAAALTTAGLWTVRAQWLELQRLSSLEFPATAAAAGRVLLQPAMVFALVLLAVGLTDFMLRHVRFEAMLRTTLDEQREDQRAMEGDLGLRARRRRIARAWRGDSPELLAGASLLLTGPDGLTFALAGGPPPRRLTVRAAAQGDAGLKLRRSLHAAALPRVEAPDLARRLARHTASATGPAMATMPPELLADLAAVWPPA